MYRISDLYKIFKDVQANLKKCQGTSRNSERELLWSSGANSTWLYLPNRGPQKDAGNYRESSESFIKVQKKRLQRS